MEAAVMAAPPPPARDVIADKQASTANGGLETSTFTVAARVRPLSSEEAMREGFACVLPAGPGKAKSTQEAMVLTPKVSLKGMPTLDKANFAFDRFFGADATDDEVYAALGRPLVHRAMAGQVGVVFAYGQTGSGKTHTMGGARTALNCNRELPMPAGGFHSSTSHLNLSRSCH